MAVFSLLQVVADWQQLVTNLTTLTIRQARRQNRRQGVREAAAGSFPASLAVDASTEFCSIGARESPLATRFGTCGTRTTAFTTAFVLAPRVVPALGPKAPAPVSRASKSAATDADPVALTGVGDFCSNFARAAAGLTCTGLAELGFAESAVALSAPLAVIDGPARRPTRRPGRVGDGVPAALLSASRPVAARSGFAFAPPRDGSVAPPVALAVRLRLPAAMAAEPANAGGTCAAEDLSFVFVADATAARARCVVRARPIPPVGAGVEAVTTATAAAAAAAAA